MATFTNTKGERVRTSKNEDGTIKREVLATSMKAGQPIPKVTTPTAITSDSLKPVTPINLTQPQPSTAVDGLGGVVQANADAFTANLAEQKKATETTKKSSLDAYIEALKTQQSQTQMEDTAYSQKGGADDLQKELNDINAQINAEIQSNRRQTEAIQKAGGQSKAQVDAQVANINRESIAKQADLSVIQMAKQGQYDSAKAIADRAVRAKFEQQKLYNEALKFNYEENKELFTKAEQREFDTLLSDRNRKLDAAEAETKTISDLSIQALQDGAPASVASAMRSAKTVAEAISIGGRYVGALDRAVKQAQLAKLNQDLQADSSVSESLSYADNAKFNATPEAKAIKDATRYAEAVSNYKDAINKYGTGQLFGRGKGALNEAYSSLVGATKDYYTLGTYDNGVEKLIALGIPKPSILGIRANRIGALDSALETASDVIVRNATQLGATKFGNSIEYANLVNEATKFTTKPQVDETDMEDLDSIYGTAGSTTQFNADDWLK